MSRGACSNAACSKLHGFLSEKKKSTRLKFNFYKKKKYLRKVQVNVQPGFCLFQVRTSGSPTAVVLNKKFWTVSTPNCPTCPGPSHAYPHTIPTVGLCHPDSLVWAEAFPLPNHAISLLDVSLGHAIVRRWTVSSHLPLNGYVPMTYMPFSLFFSPGQ